MYRPYSNGSYPPYPTQVWYPPGQGGNETNAPGGSSTNNNSIPYSRPQSTRSSASDIFLSLRNKSTEELQKLLSDQDAYSSFLYSLESVRQIESLWTELLNQNVELAKENLEKESDIFQLRNQCTIIRTTELAAAEERSNEVHKQETDLKAVYSPAVLLERLHDAASKVDEESEIIYQQLLSGETNLTEFLQNYRKTRLLYHKRTLIRLAAKTSMGFQG